MTAETDKLLTAIEASTAEIAEATVASAETADAMRKESAASATEMLDVMRNAGRNVKPPEVTVNVPPAAVNVVVPPAAVNVAAPDAWSELRVTPHKDERTGEVMSYTIRRIA